MAIAADKQDKQNNADSFNLKAQNGYAILCFGISAVRFSRLYNP